MDFVTIGEYADAKDLQREFIRAQRVDLAAGSGASEPFTSRTRSIRVAGNVPHLWNMGGEGQYRPAEVVESHDVTLGAGWVMSFEAES